MGLFKNVDKRTSLYGKAILWCAVVLTILLLPYLFSAYIDYMTHTQSEELDGFFGSLFKSISNSIEKGSFLFIPIGLSSASYIDYVFQKGLKVKEAFIHIVFFILLIVILGMYVCIDLTKAINCPELFKLEIDNVHSIVKLHFILSFLYSWGVKTLIFNYRYYNYTTKTA